MAEHLHQEPEENDWKMSDLSHSPSKFDWIFKYRLYHLPFWFVYHYLWWLLGIGSPLQVASTIFYTAYAGKFLSYLIFQAFGVYFNLYYLIPNFLEKGRYLSYISLLALTILCTASLIVTGYYAGAYFSDQTFYELYQVEPDNYFHFLKSGALSSTVASMTLAMSIKLTKNWLKAKKREQLLEKERLETELKFLKSQFNPHFLFNTINSIFVLIHKNPDMASESLAKFSDLLRYQLYECNEQQIPLERELEYFENYIELEKLRQDHNHELSLQIEPQHSGSLTIAPFILMTFIENAFKHVSHRKDQPNRILIKLSCEQNILHFYVSNSIFPEEGKSEEFIKYGGIGLKNVQRRLNLVYPGQYELDIKKEHEEFQVRLRLNLRERKVPELMAVV